MKDHIKVLTMLGQALKPQARLNKLIAISESTTDSKLRQLLRARISVDIGIIRTYTPREKIETLNQANKALREYCELMRDTSNPKPVAGSMPSTIKEVYRLIEEWCSNNPGTGSALGLMRLVLSLDNSRTWPFSVSVCIWDLDGARMEWAKAIILDYFERGEGEELFDLGRKFAPMIKDCPWPPTGDAQKEIE